MIRDFEVAKDEAGFPLLRWTEKRNLASPEAASRAKIECRIMKDAKTGVLLFVARGSVRHGLFEEGKPWERLRGFSKHKGEGLYYTRGQLELRQHLAKKGVAKFAISDGANVILAEFVEETPLHINCAEASPVDIDQLHIALTREFISNQHEIVSALCRVPFHWPKDDDRIMTYDPGRAGWAQSQSPKEYSEALSWMVAVAAVAALGFLAVWLFGGFPH